MLQKIANTACTIKTGNAFKNLFNEIMKLVYLLYRKKESRKVYNNLLG